MSQPLAGVRILEVASHVFVPIAGGVLHEWGADVVKIEHPETGDPYRSLVTQGLHASFNGIDPSFQFTNRGKRSVSIDLKQPEGQALLHRMLPEFDVFLTNIRPAARRRLKIDVEDIRTTHPEVIYVRGSGYGARGPDVERGGYDAAAYWMRGGLGAAFTPPGAEQPVIQRPAFGDVVGGLTIAGAIAAGDVQARDHRRELDHRRLADEHRHVAAPARDHARQAARRHEAARARPLHRGEPDLGIVQDARRPLPHAGDAGGGPLLARPVPRDRPSRAGGRSALRRHGGAQGERACLRRDAGRDLCRARLCRMVPGAARRQGRVGADADRARGA